MIMIMIMITIRIQQEVSKSRDFEEERRLPSLPATMTCVKSGEAEMALAGLANLYRTGMGGVDCGKKKKKEGGGRKS